VNEIQRMLRRRGHSKVRNNSAKDNKLLNERGDAQDDWLHESWTTRNTHQNLAGI